MTTYQAIPIRFVPLAACLFVVLAAGCWRASPPEIEEFRIPVKPAAVETTTSQPVEQTPVAEAPKPEPRPEEKPEPSKAPVAVAAAPAEAAPPAPEAPKGPSIVGSWRVTNMSHNGSSQPMPPGFEMKWTFGEDGTLRMEMSMGERSESKSGTYTVSGDQITLSGIEGSDKTGTVRFSGSDEMSIEVSERGTTVVVTFGRA